MSAVLSGRGRMSPTACTPHHVAKQLGLKAGQHVTWDRLLDLAVLAYWERRPEQNPRTLAEYQRRQKRRRTPVAVWLRRGAA